jgi:PBP1b-binding outer membrane lipoprotein LpoB
MKTLFLVLLSAFILSGCAGTGAKPSQVERITPEELAKLIPPPVATVSLDEIVADSKAGKSSDDIIAKIKNSNSRYELTSTQVLDLNKKGVDAKVLDYIQQSNELAKQNAMADEINKREQEKTAARRQLQRERDFNRNQFYDPFWGAGFGRWGPGFIGPIGPAGRHWRGNRFGWGLGFGHPFWW